MKKRMIILAAGVIVIMVFLVSLPFWVDINTIIASQIPNIEKKINRRLSIGNVRLTILTGLGVQIADVRISNFPESAPKDAEDTFVSARQVVVGLKMLPLFKGKINIDDITMTDPFILIQRNAQGRFNFDDMIPVASSGDTAPPEKTAPAPSTDETESSRLPLNIEISKIRIDNGTIHFMDAIPPKPVGLRLEQVSAKLGSVSLHKRMAIQLTSNLVQGSRMGHMAFSADIGPLVPSSDPQSADPAMVAPESLEIDADLNLSGIDLMTFGPYLGDIGLQQGILDGRIEAHGSLEKTLEIKQNMNWEELRLLTEVPADSPDQPKQQGTSASPPTLFRLSGPSAMEATLRGTWTAPLISGRINLDKAELMYGEVLNKPADIPFNIDFQARQTDAIWHIDSVIANITDMRCEASGSVTRKARTVGFDLALKTGLFSSASLIELFPAISQSIPAAVSLPDKVRLSMDATAASLEAIDFSGLLDLSQSAVTYKDLFDKSPATPLTLNVSGQLLPDTLTLTPVNLKLGAMGMTASGKIHHFAAPHIQAQLQLPETDIKELSPMIPLIAAHQITGRMNLSANVKGTVPDMKTAGTIRITQGTYQKTAFDSLSAKFTYTPPLIKIDPLHADIFSGTLNGTGELNIANPDKPVWHMDLGSDKIDFNSVLESLAGINDIVTGNFSGQLTLGGQGSRLTDISRSVSGSGQAAMVNGTLTTINLLNALAESLFNSPTAGQLAQALFPQQASRLQQTDFNDLSGKFDIKDGRITTRNLQLKASDYLIETGGTIGLDQTLDLDAKIRLPSSLTRSLAKHDIYKYLLDKDKNLELPFDLKGSIVKPVVRIDEKTIEDMIRKSTKRVLENKFERNLEKAKEKLDIRIPSFFQ